jgi:hypothetical protein
MFPAFDAIGATGHSKQTPYRWTIAAGVRTRLIVVGASILIIGQHNSG